MLAIIPICAETLEIINDLYGPGVTGLPKIEVDPEKETFFIYRGQDEHAEVMDKLDIAMLPEREWTMITVMVW